MKRFNGISHFRIDTNLHKIQCELSHLKFNQIVKILLHSKVHSLKDSKTYEIF